MSDEEKKDEAPFKPLFLSAQDPETWKKPEEKTWGDHFLRPDKPLSSRHRALARMVAMGATNKEIAERLNYSMSRVSVLKSNTRIQEEIQKFEDRVYEESIEERIKELAPEAIDAMEAILKADVDPLRKENTARWILEKASGKAAQQINVQGEVSLGVFLEKLDKMSTQALAPREVNPAIEGQTEESPETSEQDKTQEIIDPLEDWLDKNLSD